MLWLLLCASAAAQQCTVLPTGPASDDPLAKLNVLDYDVDVHELYAEIVFTGLYSEALHMQSEFAFSSNASVSVFLTPNATDAAAQLPECTALLSDQFAPVVVGESCTGVNAQSGDLYTHTFYIATSLCYFDDACSGAYDSSLPYLNGTKYYKNAVSTPWGQCRRYWQRITVTIDYSPQADTTIYNVTTISTPSFRVVSPRAPDEPSGDAVVVSAVVVSGAVVAAGMCSFWAVAGRTRRYKQIAEAVV